MSLNDQVLELFIKIQSGELIVTAMTSEPVLSAPMLNQVSIFVSPNIAYRKNQSDTFQRNVTPNNLQVEEGCS